MHIKHSDPEGRMQFYYFWFWQYTCRNEKYISAYKKYKNVSIPKKILKIAYQVFDYKFNEKTARMLLDAADYENRIYKHRLLDELNLELNLENLSKIYDFREQVKYWLNKRRKPFDEIFNCCPKNPKEDCDFEKILIEASNGSLSKTIKDFHVKLFKEDVIIESELPTQFGYFVDTKEKTLSEVIAEITYWYKEHETNNAEGRKKALSEYVCNIIDNELPGFKDDYLDRSVGLWLWDHKKNMEELRKSKYTVNQSIRDLFEKHKDIMKGYGTISELETSNENIQSTMRKLRRYYNAANESIKERQVLPINPSK